MSIDDKVVEETCKITHALDLMWLQHLKRYIDENLDNNGKYTGDVNWLIKYKELHKKLYGGCEK